MKPLFLKVLHSSNLGYIILLKVEIRVRLTGKKLTAYFT